MGKDTPDPPDYVGAANQQSGANRNQLEQQTWANRPTVNTPFGQQTWNVTPTWDPTTGQYLNQWESNVNLTPETQGAVDDQMAIQAGRSDAALGMLPNVQNTYSNPMSWGGFQSLNAGPGAGNVQQSVANPTQNVDPSQRYNQQANDAIYGQWSNRQEPRMQQQMDQMRTQLYNQGLKEGDQAYESQMQRMRQDQDDARTQAQYQATIGSGQEAQRMYGMDMGLRQQQFNENMGQGAFANEAAQQMFNQGQSAAGFQNNVRQQQINEALQQRNQPLNEMNALLGGQQVSNPSMTPFNTAGMGRGTDYMSALQNGYQGQMDQYNANQANMQGAMSGLASLAMMFSDRRLKENIQFVEMRNGNRWYTWDWPTGGKGEGVMADEVSPDCVVETVTGYRMVDYERLGY